MTEEQPAKGIPRLLDYRLIWAVAAAGVINLTFALSRFYDTAFDSWTHLFYAAHYSASWFGTWEPKWFGGFDVVSYTPLTHQLLGALSFFLGPERSYLLMDFLLAILFPIAIYSLTSVVSTKTVAGYAALLAAVLPAFLVVNYSYGQLTTVFSTVLALFACGLLARYLEHGRAVHLAGAVCFASSSVAAHHFAGTVFQGPLLAAILIAMLLDPTKTSKMLVLKRGAYYTAITALVSIVILLPFWAFTIASGVPTIDVVHPTSANILRDATAFRAYFVDHYLFLIPFLPFTLIPLFSNRRFWPFFVVFLAFLMLGLGSASPLSRLLFGPLWRTINYDRFPFWSSIFALPLLAHLWDEYHLLPNVGKKLVLLMVGVVVIWSLNYAFTTRWLKGDASKPLNPGPYVEFLAQDQNDQWRYMTLGFGYAQMTKLSTLTKASTVDGHYQVIQNPFHSITGFFILDQAQRLPGGWQGLEEVFENTDKSSLKFVFARGVAYDDLLRSEGFVLTWTSENTRDDRLADVGIWIKGGVPPVAPYERPDVSLKGVAWGILPPLTLLLGISFVALRIPEEWRSFRKSHR